MATEIKIPNVGESITSANVARWHKQDGESVEKGQTILTIETDKVSNDLDAEQSGVLKILVQEGEEVAIGAVVGMIEEGGQQQAATAVEGNHGSPDPQQPTGNTSTDIAGQGQESQLLEIKVPAAGESITSANIGSWHVADGAEVAKGETLVTLETDKVSNELEAEEAGVIHIIVAEGQEVDIGTVIGNIAVGAKSNGQAVSETTAAPAPSSPAKPIAAPVASVAPVAPAQTTTPVAAARPNASVELGQPERAGKPVAEDDGRTTRRKMSMLRRKIASHLVNAQQTAAILTTFNEVDMTAIMKLRKEVQEDFVAKHGCKLGFMSFFVKATVQALKDVPSINGRIEGNDIIENHFYDVGVAIGTEKGLVVPVLRDCDDKGFVDIEKGILDYAAKANDGTMDLADLQGGVFTISNGGVYGSLLSTPILNPPQSGILGMHTIQQRPVAINGEVVVRPMMYLALSYDHRLVDGKEAVTFLIRIKDCLENPSRLMLEM